MAAKISPGGAWAETPNDHNTPLPSSSTGAPAPVSTMSDGAVKSRTSIRALTLTHDDFQEQEKSRRELSGGMLSKGSLFLSHSWRKPDTQARKRMVIHAFSMSTKEGGAGLTYWADFLDLQGEGPVAWRDEIKKGIDDCSKVVCLVDEAYLTSINCIKEAAYATFCNKPLVVIALDQAGWDLLTLPGGFAKAWDSRTWGPSLSDHSGDEWVDGSSFKREDASRVFSTMSAINICPCRELEESLWGDDRMLSNAITYVSKDIAYAKQHAVLKSLAECWRSKSDPRSLLLPPNETSHWREWIKFADESRQIPAPTPLQREFVARSVDNRRRARNQKLMLAAVILCLILAGSICSVVMAFKATAAERHAHAEATRATAAEGQAVAEAIRATEAEQVAITEAMRATKAEEEALANAKSAACWTILGRLDDLTGRIQEIRAVSGLVRVVNENADIENFSGLRASVALAFYQLMSSKTLNTGEITGLRQAVEVEWSPDGGTVAIATTLPSNPVIIQQLHKEQPVVQLGPHDSPGYGLSWSRDGRWLAVSGNSGNITVWDMVGTNFSSVKLFGSVGAWKYYNPYVFQAPVVWIQDGTILASSGGTDGSVRWWDLRADPPTFTRLDAPPPLAFMSHCTGLVLPVDRRHLVASRQDGSLVKWDLLENKEPPVGYWSVGLGATTSDVSFLHDNTTVAVAITIGGIMSIRNPTLAALLANHPTRDILASTDSCPLSCSVLSLLDRGWANAAWSIAGTSTYASSIKGALLSSFEREQLAILGWNETSWSACAACNKNNWGLNVSGCVQHLYVASRTCPRSQITLWADLSENEQRAARYLSYTPAAWDASSPYSCCLQDAADMDAVGYLPVGTSADDYSSIWELTIPGGEGQVATAVAASPHGDWIAAGTFGDLHVWDKSGRYTALNVASYVVSTGWSPSGRYLAAGGLPNFGVWDFMPDRGLLPITLLEGLSNAVAVASAVSHNGARLAVATISQIYLLDRASGKRLQESALPAAATVSSLAFSPDGKEVAVGGSISVPGSVPYGILLVWAVETQGLRSIAIPTASESTAPAPVRQILWDSTSGLFAASTGGGQSKNPNLILFDSLDKASPSHRTLDVEGFYLNDVGMSADGALMAAAQAVSGGLQKEQNALFWEVATGTALRFAGSEEFSGLAFQSVAVSPVMTDSDEYILALGTTDGKLVIARANLNSGQVMTGRAMEAHGSPLTKVSFSSDGKIIASGDSSGEILVWSVEQQDDARGALVSLQQRIRKGADANSARSMAWVPNQHTLVVCDSQGVVKQTNVVSFDEMEATLRSLVLPFTSTAFTAADAAVLDVAVDALAPLQNVLSS